MMYIVDSAKSVDQASSDLEASVKNNKFGVLHVHDLKATLNSKGIDFENECRVFEVCNPVQANKVLNDDMKMNMALPCRISVWSEGSQTKIGMISPKEMLAMLSKSDVLAKIADEVEITTTKIIDEAK